jgi:hypothetical protein
VQRSRRLRFVTLGSQSLESYQLDDLPAGRNKKESRHVRISRQPRFNLSNLIGNVRGVNRAVAMDVKPIAKLLTPGKLGAAVLCRYKKTMERRRRGILLTPVLRPPEPFGLSPF